MTIMIHHLKTVQNHTDSDSSLYRYCEPGEPVPRLHRLRGCRVYRPDVVQGNAGLTTGRINRGVGELRLGPDWSVIACAGDDLYRVEIACSETTFTHITKPPSISFFCLIIRLYTLLKDLLFLSCSRTASFFTTSWLLHVYQRRLQSRLLQATSARMASRLLCFQHKRTFSTSWQTSWLPLSSKCTTQNRRSRRQTSTNSPRSRWSLSRPTALHPFALLRVWP